MAPPYPNGPWVLSWLRFSPALLDAMKAHGTRRVLVAYDRDDAGEDAPAIRAMTRSGDTTAESYDTVMPIITFLYHSTDECAYGIEVFTLFSGRKRK